MRRKLTGEHPGVNVGAVFTQAPHRSGGRISGWATTVYTISFIVNSGLIFL
jgi:hypothetical protein